MLPAQTITTFAGTGVYGYSGDGGPATAARIMDPRSITFDKKGNCYFQDWYTLIRKIDRNGIITTYAGIDTFLRYSGDGGQATAAGFRFISGIAMDTSGYMFLTMGSDNVIRRIAPNGIVTTIAGTGSAVTSGDGGAA
ncbi:MAG: hypothetical protein EBZ77_12785, partial [Chitinophagia bacterium]|nr:hypothetical protein [Chitinophagia bacterium]